MNQAEETLAKMQDVLDSSPVEIKLLITKYKVVLKHLIKEGDNFKVAGMKTRSGSFAASLAVLEVEVEKIKDKKRREAVKVWAHEDNKGVN